MEEVSQIQNVLIYYCVFIAFLEKVDFHFSEIFCIKSKNYVILVFFVNATKIAAASNVLNIKYYVGNIKVLEIFVIKMIC